MSLSTAGSLRVSRHWRHAYCIALGVPPMCTQTANTHRFVRRLFQMLAVLTMYGKIPARLKVRNLFELFDLDMDGNLNSSETILMLRLVGDKDALRV